MIINQCSQRHLCLRLLSICYQFDSIQQQKKMSRKKQRAGNILTYFNRNCALKFFGNTNFDYDHRYEILGCILISKYKMVSPKASHTDKKRVKKISENILLFGKCWAQSRTYTKLHMILNCDNQ